MNRILGCLVGLLVLSACRTLPSAQKELSIASRDGLTAETAVQLHDAKNEAAGVDAERSWIQQNYPGAKIKGQSLLMGPHAMDLIKIELPSGESRDIYFDISSFFGKW